MVGFGLTSALCVGSESRDTHDFTLQFQVCDSPKLVGGGGWRQIAVFVIPGPE
jgi:hypothetical protein